ncbi:chorismate mutase [Acinetobacter sp. 'aerobic (ED)']|uniref:chorismate mutase n=1 Tax=Acinetobacter sp. 'aerobic (ED)' TaxID=174230 RepID=UPI00192B72E6|nr:chorismate mutase [Acinetobacter sp. 'aerobic (ED)']
MLKALLLITCLCCSGFTQAMDHQLVALINQRLSWMKDVAGNKAIHHQAIEDLSQEEKVLAATLKQAAERGIEASSIRPFIMAQMDAAKAIQYRYRADWLAQPEENWQPEDLNQVRTNISKLSSEIIDSIADELYKKGNLDHYSDESFMKFLNQQNLSQADKSLLLRTLSQIRLK